MGNVTGDRTVEIDAPIERCFDIAADIEGAPEWQRAPRARAGLERAADRRARPLGTEAAAKGKTRKARRRVPFAEAPAVRWASA